MSANMSVFLSNQAADEQWGKNALLSFNGKAIHIHVTDDRVLTLIQRAARKIDGQGIKNVTLVGDEWDLENVWAFIQGHRNSKDSLNVTWPELDEDEEAELQDRLASIDWAREMINLPPEVITPVVLANRAAEMLKALAPEHISYTIIEGDDLVKEGWMGIHTVGRGSDNPPAMLQLDFNPTGKEDAPVAACLVGKGITFDSGGYSIKPSAGMIAMKADMGGAAMVTAGLALAIRRGAEKRMKLVLCCAENLVSGNAFRLGDVITYKNGKTVEIQNTDAEGRLVLADGLIFASEQNPEMIIDCATLTGAAKMALGNDYHALFSFDHSLAQKALVAASAEHEGVWPLPLAEMHRHMLPSYFADLSNIASGDFAPGASTAAAFLSHFVSDYQKGWVHFDCSATYRKGNSDLWAAGATGVGVRTLAHLLNA